MHTNENTQEFFVTDPEWSMKYLGAKAGILVMRNIDSATGIEKLSVLKTEIENKLKKDFAGFSREDINNIPTIAAYNNYYKNFGKTYHVRSQVESVLNGKSLSSASPIISAMFMAEVKNMLLTAGHDLDTLSLPVHIKIGTGNENFTDIRAAEKNTVVGDMIMMDGQGVISSIILGPDSRTKLTSNVKNVLFAVYAPAEIDREAVLSHLKDIENYVKVFSLQAETNLLEVFEAE